MKKNGFSLLEVIAAMVILGISLAAIMGMFILGNHDLVTREDQLIALNSLRAKVEEMKSIDFADLRSQEHMTCLGVAPIPTTCEMDVVVTETALPSLKKFDVTVRWNAGADRIWQQSIATYIADHS